MSSARNERRRTGSLATRITLWYIAALAVTVAALAAVAVPAIRSAVERDRPVVIDDVAVRIRDAGGRTLYEDGNVAASERVVTRTSGELRLELGDVGDPWQRIAQRLWPGAAALLALAVVLAIAGGFYITRRALRPIRTLTAIARDVSVSGDLSRRVPERSIGRDELDELTRLFNQMLEHNQRLVRGMRESLDDVAHDLRTPLTRLRGTAEVALRNSDPDAARDALAFTIEESERVLAMLRTLMDISEAEAGLMRLERSAVSLAAIVRDTLELYAHVADEAGVSLTAAPGSDVHVDVDPMRMRQAVANLVDNAIKYTRAGGRVTVELARDGDLGVVRVRDTGEGIPAHAMPRIWDRLYRADPSRSKPGLGLGLSLVRAIAHAHGGDVSVESTPGKGSLFTIGVPLSAAERVPRARQRDESAVQPVSVNWVPDGHMQ